METLNLSQLLELGYKHFIKKMIFFVKNILDGKDNHQIFMGLKTEIE